MRNWMMLALFSLSLSAEPLSKGERDQAMSHLHATRKQVLDLITPLSAAQWNFKAGPTRWSIAECAEHITETENFLRGLIEQTAKKAPVDEAKRKAKASAKEAAAKAVLAQMTDRTKTATAPGEIRPTGRFATKAALVAALNERRDTTIRYVETTGDDLRGRFFQMGPGREMDLYEMILMISGHAERHLLQMKEVMAAPGYPKQ
ncbi:MAG: DinB family protein [Bryobacterales bacterium]|nr:DinB family protein [Bryobacterales bacterium]